LPGYARRLGVAEELVDLGKSDTAAFPLTFGDS